MSRAPVVFLEVDEDGAGQRIDNLLLKVLKGVPKSHIYRILRSGEVRVNKGRATPDRRLEPGDQIRVPPVRLAERQDVSKIPPREFSPVFEDEALIVIDKPAGVAVHGGSGVEFGVIEQIRKARPQAKFLELAHRLDRETSGLLVIGKKRAALRGIHELFRSGGIDKRYLALVSGAWGDALRHVSLPLHKFLTREGERRVRVDPEGKEAHSVFRLKENGGASWGDASLLEVELRTGRTHQIRVHLAHLGFPILGDQKYGDFSLNKRLEKQGLKRMFLHAGAMRFTHPLTGEKLNLRALLPPDLEGFLSTLGRVHETP